MNPIKMLVSKLLIPAVLFSSTAHAVEFTAIVCNIKPQQLGVKFEDSSPCLPIKFTSVDAAFDFVQLEAGDRLTYEGPQVTAEVAEIEAVGSVSLKRFLGTWLSSQGSRYDFIDHKHLRITNPDQIESKIATYEIYPNSLRSWSMIVATSTIRAGHIREKGVGQEYHLQLCIEQTTSIRAPCTELKRIEAKRIKTVRVIKK